jgi:hypothetical protein
VVLPCGMKAKSSVLATLLNVEMPDNFRGLFPNQANEFLGCVRLAPKAVALAI